MNHITGPFSLWALRAQQAAVKDARYTRKKCPQCGALKAYKLGDGRKKCSVCSKKYSPHPRKSRIARILLRQVVRQFLAMVPAKQAAENVGVNHKTTLKIYKKIRLSLLQENHSLALRYIAESAPTIDISGCCPGAETVPLFVVVVLNQRIVLLPPLYEGARVKVNLPASIVCADRNGLRYLDVDKMEQKTLGSQACSGQVKPWFFWPYAKEHLKIYHGGMKANFPLFLHEMVFRFNLSISGEQVEDIVDDLVACL